MALIKPQLLVSSTSFSVKPNLGNSGPSGAIPPGVLTNVYLHYSDRRQKVLLPKMASFFMYKKLGASHGRHRPGRANCPRQEDAAYHRLSGHRSLVAF
jgi:hypothetical protein